MLVPGACRYGLCDGIYRTVLECGGHELFPSRSARGVVGKVPGADVWRDHRNVLLVRLSVRPGGTAGRNPAAAGDRAPAPPGGHAEDWAFRFPQGWRAAAEVTAYLNAGSAGRAAGKTGGARRRSKLEWNVR